jgi:hypothetical protein
MSVTFRIIEYIGCIGLIFHLKELSETLLKWFTTWFKDSILPIHLPPSGSLWLQNCMGMSWGTTGYYEEELDPFSRFPPTFDVWFEPGSRWLVIDSGESSRDDWWWIDVINIKEDGIHTGKVRIFANRHDMQEWGPKSGRMLRIDE